MKKYLLIIASTLFLSGCTAWEDFTTYFNLYYNTVEVFEQAEQQLNEQRKDPFAKFDAPVPGAVLPQLDKVIEKCSRILQFNANSSFVDDALLMIGKAFYYQKNYLKALRKFQELIATKEYSDLVPEARLWEAKTYFAMNNSEKAIALMDEVKKEASLRGDTGILKLAYLEEIRHFLLIEDFDRVLPMLTAFVEFNSDDELNSRVMYQAGEIMAQKEDYNRAAQYYRSAYDDFLPNYETSYLARLKSAKMKLYLDNGTEALEEFYVLRDDPKYKEFMDQSELAIGITYIRLGQFDDAHALLRRFDTTYSASQQAGNARYVLAQLYEKDYKLFDSAIIFYQKALTSSATAEYLPLIRERATIFNKYSNLVRDYFSNRKQFYYLTNPDVFTRDSLLFAQDTTGLQEQAIDATGTTNTAQSNVQERFRDFDNELNITEVIASMQGTAQTVTNNGPVRPTISIDSSKSLMSRAAIELGNIFLTSLSIPDSASFYYNEVISVFGSKSYQPKALYGLAGYYALKNDSVTADSLYRFLYDNYKDDKIVNEAAKKINKPQIDFDFDPAKDLYFEAETAFLAGKDSVALSKFEFIRQNHQKSKYFAQAIYSNAYVLETRFKMYDSAATLYDTLVTKYPTTVFAQKVQPKLSFYKEEKARIRQAILDSLQHIQDSLQRIQDSIRTDSIARVTRDSLAAKQKADSLLQLQKPLSQPGDSTKVTTPEMKPETTPNEEVQPEKKPEGTPVIEQKKEEEEVAPPPEETAPPPNMVHSYRPSISVIRMLCS